MNHIEFNKKYFYPFLKENNLLLYFNKPLQYYELKKENDKSFSFNLNIINDDDFNFFKSSRKFTIDISFFYNFLYFLLEKKLSTEIIQKISIYKNWDTIFYYLNNLDNHSSFFKKLFDSNFNSKISNSTFKNILFHLRKLENCESTFLFTKNNINYLNKNQFFLLKKLYYSQNSYKENNQFLELETFFKNNQKNQEDYNSNMFLDINKNYDTIILNFEQLKKDFFIDIYFEDSEYIKILKSITQNLKKYQSKFDFQNIIFDCPSINPKYVSFLLEKKADNTVKKELIQKFIIKFLENYQHLIIQEIQKDDLYTISCFYKAKEFFYKNSLSSTILNFVLLEESVSKQNNNKKNIKI